MCHKTLETDPSKSLRQIRIIMIKNAVSIYDVIVICIQIDNYEFLMGVSQINVDIALALQPIYIYG